MNQTLVLLHGWGYTPKIWDGLRAELSNFELCTPLLLPPCANLATWADELTASLPDDAILIGWSLGAMLAMNLAARHPAKVRGLFLIGASPCFVAHEAWAHGLEANTVTAFRAGFRRNPARTQQRFVALQVLGDSQRHALAPLLENALADPAEHATALEAGLQILAEADLRSLELPPGLPVLLLHGRQDALMPVAAAEYLQSHHAGARLHIIEDAGHAPLLSQPAALARHIQAFSDAL
ncbi:pimeloyl-ACP methyl ester esterase BioH [Uliginosibacterium flavum]|uniref:Alpha/beta fold hydrolase n=1 Tax=Uliginosibacterium flavum TaxID=1396831 RepID=A0ABV2TIK1_9RHOO